MKIAYFRCTFQMHISDALLIVQREMCVPLSHIEVLTLLAYTIVYRTTVLIR